MRSSTPTLCSIFSGRGGHGEAVLGYARICWKARQLFDLLPGLLRYFATVSRLARCVRWGGSPRRTNSTSSTTICPISVMISGTLPARCAERIVLEVRRARWSVGMGSCGKTSMAARIWPDSAASSRSSKFTIPARLASTTTDPRCIRLKYLLSSEPAFSVVVGARMKTTLERRNSSSSPTGCNCMLSKT